VSGALANDQIEDHGADTRPEQDDAPVVDVFKEEGSCLFVEESVVGDGVVKEIGVVGDERVFRR
jgi:hypothetical protein